MQLPNTRISDKLFFYLAVGTALFALFMHIGIARTNLPRSAWRVAAKYIRTHYQRGDAIALLPPWALKGAEPLRDLPILLTPTPHKDDLRRYRRLWVLVAPRLGKWWFTRSYDPILRSLDELYWRRQKRVFGWRKISPIGIRSDFGFKPKESGVNHLEVYLYQLPPPRPPLYDFSAKANLRQAEVGIELPQTQHRVGICRATQSHVTWLRRWQEHPGWFRGRGDYFFGRIIQEIGNTPRDCIYAQPQRCRILKVRYRNVPLYGRLRLEHGFTTPAPGKVTATVPPDGPDVLVTIFAENRRIKELRVSQKQRWRTAWIDLSALKFPRRLGSVELHFQTPDRQQTRVGYCFRAEIRK